MNELFPAEQTAAAYIRVSTARQDEYSPDSQLKLIRDYAQKNGLIVPDEFIFFDDGISGSKAEKRQAFIDMIAIAKDKHPPFKTILVWKYSRFARNQEESIVYKNLLKKNGVQVVSISEPITDDPFGSLIERIIEWMDEYYLIRLSPEVKRGQLEKLSRGEPVQYAPIGYIYNKDQKKFVPDPQYADIIRMIYEQYTEGIPMRKIAMDLNNAGIRTQKGNVFNSREIEYIISNPIYIGKLRRSLDGKKKRTQIKVQSGYNYYDGNHEAIISEELWQKAQQRSEELAKREVSARRGATANYMLKGIVKCSCCGGNLIGSSRTGMQCSNYNKATCNESHFIYRDKLNEAVIEAIKTYAINDELQIKIKPKPKDTTTIDYNKLIGEAKTKLTRLTQAYIDGLYSIEELKPFKEKIENEIATYEAELNKPVINDIDMSAFRNSLISLVQILESEVSETIKNEALRSIIDSIVFDRKASKLTINFFY